jgi:hypothetical protein
LASKSKKLFVKKLKLVVKNGMAGFPPTPAFPTPLSNFLLKYLLALNASCFGQKREKKFDERNRKNQSIFGQSCL